MAFNQTKWEFSDEKEAEMTGFQLPARISRTCAGSCHIVKLLHLCACC